ncbi:MAG: hypothetical protein U9R04_01785, partial [Chloroflexota bacterium]|nr:hypothetical protein [Chloroflexota bacterium]
VPWYHQELSQLTPPLPRQIKGGADEGTLSSLPRQIKGGADEGLLSLLTPTSQHIVTHAYHGKSLQYDSFLLIGEMIE